jgi:dTDP-4-amino-4,6-dideoxygalactose transaminase
VADDRASAHHGTFCDASQGSDVRTAEDHDATPELDATRQSSERVHKCLGRLARALEPCRHSRPSFRVPESPHVEAYDSIDLADVANPLDTPIGKPVIIRVRIVIEVPFDAESRCHLVARIHHAEHIARMATATDEQQRQESGHLHAAYDEPRRDTRTGQSRLPLGSTTMTRIYLSPPDVGPADRQMLEAAFDSGWIAPVGPDIALFEKEVAAVVGMPHTVALSSGTAALHLALLELGVGHGDDVLVSTFTFVATANAVTYVGARPVFIDSETGTWNMSPDLLAEELSLRARRGRLPKAVIVVDLYGQCADYGRIKPLCEEYDIPLIEDAAEALGATYAGQPAGSFGDFSVFSFNGNKIITTGGGGMLATLGTGAADHIRYLATQARNPAPHYEHTEIGYNYRLSNLLAALGRSQLADLGRRVARRRAHKARYREVLADLPVSFQPDAENGTATNWLTCVTVEPEAALTPVELISHLDSEGIEARPTWKPMHLQPIFLNTPSRVDGTAEGLFRRGLCLPSGSSLSDDDHQRVCNSVLNALVSGRQTT